MADINWTLHPIGELVRLEDDWNRLSDAAGALPFMQTRFITPLCEVFGDAELRVARCEDSSGVAAMGILSRRGVGMWETFQPSQLPLGAWLVRPDQRHDTLLPALGRALPGMTLAIGITQQDPSCTPRPTESDVLRTLDYIQTARVPICGSFDAYWAKRGKNLRHNMKRQRAKLQQDGVHTRLEMLTRREQVAEAIEQYGQLESGGWKAGYGTAVHPDNDQGRFYRSMLESFCDAGRCRIYRYRFDERVVAIDLCIEGGGAIVILKTTYDESIKTISPAFLMREEAFRGLFEEQRLERIEFFGKLMEWHTRWTDDVRTLYHVNWYRSSLLPSLGSVAARLRNRAEPPPVNAA
jgi:CelD/BcsL family acetyltransferase involved in cellulose biosynthesis